MTVNFTNLTNIELLKKIIQSKTVYAIVKKGFYLHNYLIDKKNCLIYYNTFEDALEALTSITKEERFKDKTYYKEYLETLSPKDRTHYEIEEIKLEKLFSQSLKDHEFDTIRNKADEIVSESSNMIKRLVNDKNEKYKEYLKIQLKKFIEED